MGILLSILMGALAGFLAGKIMNVGMGLLIEILVGIAGGAIGGWLFGLIGLESTGGVIGQLVVAVIGAVVLLWHVYHHLQVKIICLYHSL